MTYTKQIWLRRSRWVGCKKCYFLEKYFRSTFLFNSIFSANNVLLIFFVLHSFSRLMQYNPMPQKEKNSRIF